MQKTAGQNLSSPMEAGPTCTIRLCAKQDTDTQVKKQRLYHVLSYHIFSYGGPSEAKTLRDDVDVKMERDQGVSQNQTTVASLSLEERQ